MCARKQLEALHIIHAALARTHSTHASAHTRTTPGVSLRHGGPSLNQHLGHALRQRSVLLEPAQRQQRQRAVLRRYAVRSGRPGFTEATGPSPSPSPSTFADSSTRTRLCGGNGGAKGQRVGRRATA